MAAPALSPELQALIDETKKKGDKPTVQAGPVDNPMRSPTIQQILNEEQTDTAPNAGGRAAANALVGGFGPQTLPYLQKYFEQPLRKIASSIREGVGASPLPDVPVNTEQELQEQLARDKEKRPIASGVGAGAVEGARTVGGAAMMPFAAPAMAGSAIGSRALALAAGGLPGSAGKRAGEVIRGEKTGEEAASDIGFDTVLNAGSSVLGPLGKFGAGGKIANASRPFTSAEQTLALQQGRKIMPRFEREMATEVGPGGPPGLLSGAGTAVKNTPWSYGAGVGGVAEAGAQLAGLPHAVGGLIGGATPAMIAGLREIGKNVGSRSASQALSMLANNPALVLKLAGNPTLYQQAIEALMSGTTSEMAAP